MNRLLLGAWALTALAACNDPTRLAEQSGGPAASAVQAQYTVQDLGAFGGDESGALGINNDGDVVGYAHIATGEDRAILWRAGRAPRSLGTLGGVNSRARGINDRDQVAGFSELNRDSPKHHAFIWSEAAGMRDLGTLGGGNSQAWGINNLGEVVGGSDLRGDKLHAFLWRPGRGMQDLGTLGGRSSEARRINDAGEVVGTSETASGHGHAFIWTAAHGMEDLGTLGGAESRAIALSQTGAVVGSSETAAGKEEAFLWTRAGGMVSLGNLPNHSDLVEPNGVNGRGEVVGTSLNIERGGYHPWIWTEERGMRRLPTLGGGQGYPRDLNESGQLVGFGVNALQELHATLWAPSAGSSAVHAATSVAP